jgi:fluoride ion exporter CrcB/FEX
MRNYLVVFIGGGFGAVARSGFFGIPLGTFPVNVTGSLLLGF